MNAAETEAALRDLAQWEAGIKAKDKELRTITSAMHGTLPPVRGRAGPAAAAAPAAASLPTTAAASVAPAGAAKRIKGSDYRAWDKFVVRGETFCCCLEPQTMQPTM
jgi:hypothetical protein